MLKRLPWSLLRETATLHLLGVGAICLLLSVDLLSVLARFLIQQDATLADTGRLLLYKLPWFLHLSLPIAVVFAVLLAGGRMAKDSELKAAYSLGVSPLSLLTPLILFGLLVGLVSLVNNGFLESRAEARYQEKIDSFIYVRPPPELQLNAAYRIGDDVYFSARVRADTADPRIANLSGVMVTLADGTLIAARGGVWDAGERVWRLTEVQVSPLGVEPTARTELVLPFALEATPSETLSRPQELPLDQLWRQYRAIQGAGGDARAFAFDLHRRVADAFSAAIFAAFAGSIALRVRGRAAGFAWTIVLMVGFWAAWVLSANLFEAGALAPVPAAWLTPAITSIGAAVLAVRSLRS